MTTRVDWHDDPDAPEITSVVPSAAVYVEHAGRVLLIERTDNGNWSMPGGGHDLDESMTGTAIRETLEETGLDVEVTGLVGIFSDPRHRIEYRNSEHPEVRAEFSIVYRARPLDPDQQPTTSSESRRVEWVDVDELDDLPMDRSQRMRLDHARASDTLHIDPR